MCLVKTPFDGCLPAFLTPGQIPQKHLKNMVKTGVNGKMIIFDTIFDIFIDFTVIKAWLRPSKTFKNRVFCKNVQKRPFFDLNNRVFWCIFYGFVIGVTARLGLS